MKKYEGMFIIKPDLPQEASQNLIDQIGEVITKNSGKLETSDIWTEKKKMFFTIKKYNEGTYYLATFTLPPEAVAKLHQAYKLNEDILRVMITSKEQEKDHG